MSDTLAEKDPKVVLAEALTAYEGETGNKLAQSDPRRLHLQAFLLLLDQLRQLIDFSGKQSLLRFVSDEWIDELGELWDNPRLPALGSKCTQRFVYPAATPPRTVPAGVRVSDGTNEWAVIGDTEGNLGDVSGPTLDVDTTEYVIDTIVECTVTGGDTNGVAINQITTIVDPDSVPGVTSSRNLTETDNGRNVEGVEDYRERLRDSPESESTCGPRNAYRANGFRASTLVADCVALGPDDGEIDPETSQSNMFGTPPDPGEVFVYVIQGTRDPADGSLTSVIPDPDASLLTTVEDFLTASDIRPLGDSVTVKEPEWVEIDVEATYYIARSRSEDAAAIQAAAEQAFDDFQLWQQSKIGRDPNPSELVARLVNAGAKRVNVTDLSFNAIKRDQSVRIVYAVLTYGGVEDD